MKETMIQKKVLILFSILSIAILLCFSFFYINVLNNLIDTNTNYVEQVSESMIITIENTFDNLEYAAITFSNNASVKSLLVEEDALTYHRLAEELKADLNSLYQSDGLVNNIILYDTNAHYYRFRGTLGNTYCDRIAILLSQTNQNHLALELANDSYIAYVSDIYNGGTQLGSLVFLIQTSDLVDLFENFDNRDSIQVLLLANSQVIASNIPDGDIIDIDTLEKDSEVYTKKQIGYTEFEIIVTTKNDFISQTRESFVLFMMIAILALLAIITLFYQQLNKIFFKPMITVIDNVKSVTSDNNDHLIDLTGESDFDKLITEVNSMIEQLDDNAKTLLHMQYQTQNALIEKQQLDIDFLKKQINVHFIVNTIAAIKRLNELGDNKKSGEMCTSLALILRYANNAQDYINAVEELHILELYIDIMKLKYANSITCVYELDSETDDLMLPRMLLQPIIENALVHGTALVEQGVLIIKTQVIDQELIITIQDNGVGMSPDTLEALRYQLKLSRYQPFSEKGIEHIALINIQRRLSFIFGDAYELVIDSVEGEGTTVRMNLPLLHVDDFDE
ncbi:MAG: histidine kinase [Eubacteriales bacterium]